MNEKTIWRYYYFTHVHHKWQSYDVWFLRYRVCDRQNFLSFRPFFALLPPPKNPKNKNFEKMKKTTGDIILHNCTINENHMMYSSWDMKCDGQNFSSFWTVLCPFSFKIFKNWKKYLEISSFYTSVPKIMIICYIVP